MSWCVTYNKCVFQGAVGKLGCDLQIVCAHCLVGVVVQEDTHLVGGSDEAVFLAVAGLEFTLGELV